jgi:hypothetical protein
MVRGVAVAVALEAEADSEVKGVPGKQVLAA